MPSSTSKRWLVKVVTPAGHLSSLYVWAPDVESAHEEAEESLEGDGWEIDAVIQLTT